MKTNEIKQLTVAELRAELTASRRERFNLCMQQATKQLTQTHRLKLVRRKIAKMYTILQQKIGQAS